MDEAQFATMSKAEDEAKTIEAGVQEPDVSMDADDILGPTQMSGDGCSQAIAVRNLTGKLLAEVSTNDTIYEIKAEVERKARIPRMDQRLVFGEVVLNDGSTPSDHKIRSGSTIVCVYICEDSVKVCVAKAAGFQNTTLADISLNVDLPISCALGELKYLVYKKVRAKGEQERLDSILTANANVEVEIVMPEKPALNGQIATVVESVGPSEWKVKLVRETCNEGRGADADWVVADYTEHKIQTENLRLTQHAQDKLKSRSILTKMFFPVPPQYDYNIYLHLRCNGLFPFGKTPIGELHNKYSEDDVLHFYYSILPGKGFSG